MQARPLTVDVLDAHDVIATDGVTKGEAISFADELVLDDVYQLRRGAAGVALALLSDRTGLRRAEGDGHQVHLDCTLTLMDPDSGTHEVLILVAVEDGTVADIWVMPLGEMCEGVDYRLVGITRAGAAERFAQAASGAFARGTRITLHGGEMCAIEDLRPGDMILTRDAGPQPLLRVEHATLRATGSFAPVVIAAGALNNDATLVLRPDHRLFIYQRSDAIGVGRAEVLVKARHLVDDNQITRRKGGFVDYFQLILERHHIIFAEGIAAESHLVDPRLRPSETGHSLRGVGEFEVKDNLIPLNAAAALRKASNS